MYHKGVFVFDFDEYTIVYIVSAAIDKAKAPVQWSWCHYNRQAPECDSGWASPKWRA